MKTFNISLEFSLEAETALDAAKELQKWLVEDAEGLQYYIQDDSNKKVYSVDLSEEDEDAVLPIENYTPIIN